MNVKVAHGTTAFMTMRTPAVKRHYCFIPVSIALKMMRWKGLLVASEIIVARNDRPEEEIKRNLAGLGYEF